MHGTISALRRWCSCMDVCSCMCVDVAAVVLTVHVRVTLFDSGVVASRAAAATVRARRRGIRRCAKAWCSWLVGCSCLVEGWEGVQVRCRRRVLVAAHTVLRAMGHAAAAAVGMPAQALAEGVPHRSYLRCSWTVVCSCMDVGGSRAFVAYGLRFKSVVGCFSAHVSGRTVASVVGIGRITDHAR